MLQNNSELLIVLEGLNDSLTNRQIFFAFALTSYVFTVFVNLTLILTICLERSLHEPIYFFCIFAVYGYVFCEFTSLTVMAYDRYLAICRPLQYRTLMTPQRVVQLLLVTWMFSLLETAGGTVLTARLALCKHTSPRSSAPTGSSGSSWYRTHTWSGLRSGLSSDRRKFVQTCLPHLITLFVFTLSLMFDTLHSRYKSSTTPQIVLNVLAAEFLVVPPLINPIVYGMNRTRSGPGSSRTSASNETFTKTHHGKSSSIK
ncbi:Olfactory receptor-like protein OLF4 [Nibea albiflora]|uniref:Olfactory receptor-like protein OLF4 n=1 Tax=Nibea albiflora TaxID=240163 RepID=A0ACB7EIH2_NIBAL|nr:Olfactory receptor-like protein OLF4 [Nibea albiflora]